MLNKLIGRKDEVKILDEMLSSNNPEFMAVYGRRRVGKTFLIKTFFENKDVVFFNVTGSKDAPMKEQIKHFTRTGRESFL